MIKEMAPDEVWAFRQDRCKWKAYRNIEEYVEDIVTILVYSTWHYSEKEAREIVKDRYEMVKDSYTKKEPADDCAYDVGYFCG